MDYEHAVLNLQAIVDAAEKGLIDKSQVMAKVEPFHLSLIQRAGPVAYSQQLIKGAMTEIGKYVKGKSDRLAVLRALDRLKNAGAFEARR